MITPRLLRFLHILLFACTPWVGLASNEQTPTRPNIILILADDLGYADLGCQGATDVKTPHIDSLAKNGVRCTDGYVTSPQCAPARAGLMTGRSQNRFAFESNEQGYAPGIPVEQKILSERLKEVGYATGMMGKWGLTNRRWGHPPQRGFDVAYWNHDGNLHFPPSPDSKGHDTKIRRNNDPAPYPEYSTDAFTDEAVAFIKDHAEKPFFLYLPYITPHVPMEAKPEDLARFKDEKDPLRRTFLAMMANLDDNIGRLLDTLRQLKLEENTLIFFLSDNGGYAGNSSRNTPFRGTKSQMLEGGIRVPYLVQWKAKLPKGEVYRQPVSSLDVAPTALAAAGIPVSSDPTLDGVNLIPYLEGRNQAPPHDALYWRFNFPLNKPEQHGWAIRQGDWKLVKNGWARTPPALYNLADDPQEKNDLTSQYPQRVAQMRAAWEAWDQNNVAPAIP